MPIKKSELYSKLWKSCDALRGGMDASQYKDYILILLFVKYVSDKYGNNPDAMIVVPEGGSFKDMVALKGTKEIGDRMNKIIGNLAQENNLKGVIDVADFNDSDKLGKGKDMQDRLTNLISIFEDPALDFSRNRAEGDDLLGDAYEYLMRNFATESGKSKGQFYTPAEVSRVIAKVIGISKATLKQSIYDPTCGSGSLLIRAADETEHGITIYGQEMDNTTAALAKMNMILHDLPTAEIWQDNTLSSPNWKDADGNLKTFDFAVANPPFSMKAWRTGIKPEDDKYDRFKGYGIPPEKNGDYAFLLHLIKSLKSNGKGAIILPHGVLFRGGQEAVIRKSLISKGYIKGIIGLPPNLFYGTGIPACIIVIDKENAVIKVSPNDEAEVGTPRDIFMIDASKGFIKDGNKNRLRHQDIHKIVDVFNNQIELEKYSRMIPVTEIEKNEYNLNIPRYIDNQEPEDIQDIDAHLRGGIPDRDIDALAQYWQVYPSLKSELFAPSDRANYSQLKIDQSNIKQAIYTHPEFEAFISEVNKDIGNWRDKHAPMLKSLDVGAKPKQIAHQLSEDILQSFADIHLIDKYDIYQHLLSYWSETMQDDVYMIAVDGWQANKDLIPSQLIVDRYFAYEQRAIEQLESEKENYTRQKEEIEEEHGGEEGYLEELKSDNGKVNKALVQKRAKELKGLFASKDSDEAAELKVLEGYLELIEKESAANKKIKEAKNALDKLVSNKYRDLSPDEVKMLVVDDKWMAVIESDVRAELEGISHILNQRIKTLAERYSKSLPNIVDEVEGLMSKVKIHLNKMGFIWK